MGRPVVANDHPEQSLVLAESKAGICVPWNESQFAGAIIDLLQNPEQIRAMGRRGRAWVESNRTNNIMADLVESTYIALTSPTKSTSISDARSHGDVR